MIRVGALGLILAAGVAAADESRLRIDVEHGFSRQDAKSRAQMLFNYWRQAFGVQCTWAGDTAHVAGTVMGVSINADLVVDDDRIGGDTEDPGPFLRSLARSYITRKLQKYMHPQYLEP